MFCKHDGFTMVSSAINTVALAGFRGSFGIITGLKAGVNQNRNTNVSLPLTYRSVFRFGARRN